MPSTGGLLARKWGSFSLRSDCVITYPVFLTPQTRRVQICPHALGLPKACHTLVRSSSASGTRRDVGTGGGWRWVALSWRPSHCPGLPRQTSTRAKAEEWQERRVPGWWQAEVRGTGDTTSHSRSPLDWAGAASGRGPGHPLPPVREPCGFSGPPFQRGGSGSPLTTLPLCSPSPGWATVAACRGSGCRVSAHGASAFGSFGAGRPGNQLHSIRSGKRAAPVARRSLPPPPLLGRW